MSGLVSRAAAGSAGDCRSAEPETLCSASLGAAAAGRWARGAGLKGLVWGGNGWAPQPWGPSAGPSTSAFPAGAAADRDLPFPSCITLMSLHKGAREGCGARWAISPARAGVLGDACFASPRSCLWLGLEPSSCAQTPGFWSLSHAKGDVTGADGPGVPTVLPAPDISALPTADWHLVPRRGGLSWTPSEHAF